ncbi:hypothetical protein [Kutzneria buriramensis]|uniref:Tetratricopeptide repeat protein n=1 Tax=Kutzneria buriramensis TaxID=1045776 RepID=A0A3E0HQE8_9PSEU|nr:hypothetical protein [Kutzneria buriramensis]REH48639.1 hypothetical protein BCF44_105498 [Kutzneria buriramensis]
MVRNGHDTARISDIARRLSTSDDPWRRAAGELLHGYGASELSDGNGAKAEGHFARAATEFRELGDRIGVTVELDTNEAPDQFRALLRMNYAQTLAATGQTEEAGRQHR